MRLYTICIPRDSSKCTNHDTYYFHSSGSVDILVQSACTAMSIIVHSCVSLYTTVISGRLCFSSLSVKSRHISNFPASLFSATGKGWWPYHCRYSLTHIFCIVPSEPVKPPRRGASCIPPGQAFCIQWQYAILFRWIHRTNYTVVSQMCYLCCAWPNLIQLFNLWSTDTSRAVRNSV